MFFHLSIVLYLIIVLQFYRFIHTGCRFYSILQRLYRNILIHDLLLSFFKLPIAYFQRFRYTLLIILHCCQFHHWTIVAFLNVFIGKVGRFDFLFIFIIDIIVEYRGSSASFIASKMLWDPLFLSVGRQEVMLRPATMFLFLAAEMWTEYWVPLPLPIPLGLVCHEILKTTSLSTCSRSSMIHPLLFTYRRLVHYLSSAPPINTSSHNSCPFQIFRRNG